MSEIVLGIDFGTTNSSVGFVKNSTENVSLIPFDQIHSTVPTAIFYDKNNTILFGHEAVSSYISGEEGRFIRSIKRILGTDLMDKSTLINSQMIKFDTLIQAFLTYLKKNAENFCKTEISSVVIGRPVHFQNSGEEADKKAQNKLQEMAKLVGFKNITFQYEPIAAAFAHEQKLSENKLAFIVDLGGGTSDFTVIKIGPSYRSKKERYDDILATHGIRIGGNDLDRDFSLLSFMPSFGKGSCYGLKKLPVPHFLYSHLAEWSLINFCYTLKNKLFIKEILTQQCDTEKIKRLYELLDMKLAHNLLKLVEDAKIDLTSKFKAQIKFQDLSDDLVFYVERENLEKAIQPELEKIKEAIWETLTKANVPAEKIDFIILTGGTCKVPAVKKMIEQIFPQASISENAKMESVCIGLTLTAQRNFY